MPKKDTKESFIEKAIKKHGDKYDYSKVVYKNSGTPVIIGCRIEGHKDFPQRPGNHLSGQGCPKCKAKNNNKDRRLSTEEVIRRFKKAHGDRYDYSLVRFVDVDKKVDIIVSTIKSN